MLDKLKSEVQTVAKWRRAEGLRASEKKFWGGVWSCLMMVGTGIW